MMNQRKIVGILLAAGVGRRFDRNGLQNKLLQRLPDGHTVAQAAAINLLGAGIEVMAVVPASASNSVLSSLLLAAGCQVIECTDAAEGMAHSLVCALRHLPIDTAGIVIALADMPLIRPASIRAVVDALLTGAEIVVPHYAGKRGHPVGFAQCHFAELMGLQGDQGARRLLQTYPSHVLSLDDPGVLQDIDTMEDWRQLST